MTGLEIAALVSAGTQVAGMGQQMFNAGKTARDAARLQNKFAQDQMILSNQLTTDLQNKSAQHQLDYFMKTAQYNSPESQAARLRQAGLNPALALTGAAGAGGSGATGAAPSGSVSPAGAVAPNTVGAEANKNAAMQQATKALLDLQLTKAQVSNLNSQSDKNEADAERTRADTKTVNEQRDVLIEEIKQRGMATWLDNISKGWKMENPGINPDQPNEGATTDLFKNNVYGVQAVNSNSLFSKEQAVQVLEAYMSSKNMEASAWLTNEKAQNYWRELMNALLVGNSEAAKNNAQALATKWGIGEYTNWKTWVDTGLQTIESVAGAVGAIKGTKLLPGQSSSTTQGNFTTKSTSKIEGFNTNVNYRGK